MANKASEPKFFLARWFRDFSNWLTYENLRPTGVFVCVVAIIGVGWWADPGDKLDALDRVYYWVFVAFAVGLAEMFLLFLLLAIMGKIDLIGALSDKEETQTDPTIARISFARLQAFLWTLIILIVYFHKAVTEEGPNLPDLNSNLILVMGISGAVYLASKKTATTAEAPSNKTPAAPPAPPPISEVESPFAEERFPRI